MEALLVVDAQNEFSPAGMRPVAGHEAAMEAIRRHVAATRADGRPIAWMRHHNRPHEGPAFAPGSWGAAWPDGLGPARGSGPECEFLKEVYGSFTGTGLEDWLRAIGADTVLVVGFAAHMCVATTAREALSRSFAVLVDPGATGAWPIEHPGLGRQDAADVVRTALLHVLVMGAALARGARVPVVGAAP